MVFQISFGPISWLMVSEIFPLRTRGRGISLAVLTNFGSNAIVTFAFSPLKVLIWHLSIHYFGSWFSYCSSFSSSCDWLWGNLLILQEWLGAENLFLLFGAIALLSLLFVILVVPETKGLSLEEIESKVLKWNLVPDRITSWASNAPRILVILWNCT